MIEAKKLAFDDAARFYADPDFVKVPVAKLVSKEYAAERRALINPDRALLEVAPSGIVLETGETTYLVVADKDRNFVSLIQSNYSGFGSGPVPDGLGFCLQDRGALFNLDPKHPNALVPHKRPFHTIIPAMVTPRGKARVRLWRHGGSMQAQGHVQVLGNLIDFGMNIQEAGDAPRFYHTGSSEPTGEVMRDGGRVALEGGISPEVIRGLMEKGHRIVGDVGGFGGYQGIWWDRANDVLIGASESRKDGCAVGVLARQRGASSAPRIFRGIDDFEARLPRRIDRAGVRARRDVRFRLHDEQPSPERERRSHEREERGRIARLVHHVEGEREIDPSGEIVCPGAVIVDASNVSIL